MGSDLKQLLRSLCTNSVWNYAVFWKLNHQIPMILTWEDEYFDSLKPAEPVQSISQDIYFSGQYDMLSSCCKSIHDGSYGEYPIALAVADMSHLQYTLGEGIVGQVAYTGNYCWILRKSTGEFSANLVAECPDEWRLQFDFGIQTVLLVPAFPDGVLQLGSLEAVGEDFAVVEYIINKFKGFQNAVDNIRVITSNMNIEAQSSYLVSSVMTKFDEPLASTNFLQNNLPCEDDELHANETVGIDDSSILDQSVMGNLSELVDHKMFQLPCHEESQVFSHCNNYNSGAFWESTLGTMSFYSIGDMEELEFEDKDVRGTGYNSFDSVVDFPMDIELHKALEPASGRMINEYMSDISAYDAYQSASLVCNRNPIDGNEPLWLSKQTDIEHLLEAFVSNLSKGSDDISCKESNSVQLSTSISGRFAMSSQPPGQSEAIALYGDEPVPCSHVTSAFSCGSIDCLRNSSNSRTPKSMMSSLTQEELPKKGRGNMQIQNGAKLSNVKKRRSRSGDNHRPRPRDRQMIQNRVSELRKMVPDGAKCSIDGLLEKTIKHMLFLRTVTDQAEKLKHGENREVVGQKSWRSSEPEDSLQNGTCCAFEVKSELQPCPIVVEDLKYPGHMLIEMLCNEHGVFMEIAEVLQDLKLTILKGKMERHSNNMWACFIVEASKEFHRMDIFWPLMRILQRKRNPISSMI